MFTWIEIKASAIRHNLREFRRLAGKKKLLMPVIKSNAYGHGFLEVAKLCNKNKEVDRLCVVSLEEALKLIKNKISKPIVILGFYDLDDKNLALAVKHGVAFPIYTFKQAKKLAAIGKKINRRIIAHLKIDTGASRIGLLPNEAAAFVEMIKKKFNNIYLEGLWSHFSASETDDRETKRQWEILAKVDSDFRKRGVRVPIKHMACSAATVLFPFTHGNAIRLGLALYGLHSSKRTLAKLKLRPALAWFTTIIQVKKIPAGVKIGYGGTYTTRRPTKLAVMPVGYFDGYDRKFSNRASVIVRGIRCPVRGMICMNLTMFDASAVSKVAVGDKVTLIGQGQRAAVTADELARLADTINYEIVSRVNPLLPRVVMR